MSRGNLAKEINRKVFAALILSLASAADLQAQSTSTWNIPGNGNWNTAGNWSPSGVPVSNPATVLTFAGSTAYTATDNTTGSSFQLEQLIFNNGSSGGVTIGYTGSKSLDVATAGTATSPSILQNGSSPVLISAAINNSTAVFVGGSGTGGVTFATVGASAGFTVNAGNTFGVTINQYTVTGGNRSLTNSNTALPLTVGNIFLSNNANNGRQLTLAATGPIIITGVIADYNGTGSAGSIVKSNTGSLTLNAQSTYTGSTTLNNGTTFLGISNALPITTTLSLGNSSGVNSGILDLSGWNQQLAGLQVSAGNTGTANAIINSSPTLSTLTIANSTATTFSGSIGTPGNAAIAVTVNGPATLTLVGSSSYSGGTVINGGTLRINNIAGSGTGTGPVTINNGGSLEGTGSTASAITVNAGGTLSAGAANAGTLTLAAPATLTFAAGSFLGIGISNGNTPAAPGSGSSTNGTLPSPSSNSFFDNASGFAPTGLNFATLLVNLNGVEFSTLNVPYSYVIARGLGDQSGLNVTSAEQFDFYNLGQTYSSIGNASLTGDSSGNVYLNFTPVPEPALLLILLAALLRFSRFISPLRS